MFKISIFVVFLVTLSFGQRTFVNCDSILNFQNNFKMGTFRSGLTKKNISEDTKYWVSNKLDQVSIEFEDEQTPLSLKSYNNWLQKNDCDYQVLKNKPTERQIYFLTEVNKIFGLTKYSYNSEENIMNFKSGLERQTLIKNVIFSKYSIKEIEMINKGKIVARNILQRFKGRIEFSNADFEYIDKKPLFCHLQYRRIFRHGLVLERTSFVTIVIGADGKPYETSFCWPVFKKIDCNYEAINIDDAIKNAMDDFSNITSVEVTDSLKTYNKEISKTVIKGISLAWKTVELDNMIVISPCYAYCSEMTLKDGSKITYNLEIPRLKKYFQ
jgi:hypothetical protein